MQRIQELVLRRRDLVLTRDEAIYGVDHAQPVITRGGASWLRSALCTPGEALQARLRTNVLNRLYAGRPTPTSSWQHRHVCTAHARQDVYIVYRMG